MVNVKVSKCDASACQFYLDFDGLSVQHVVVMPKDHQSWTVMPMAIVYVWMGTLEPIVTYAVLVTMHLVVFVQVSPTNFL